jgi:limonene-1,2-epoxide hydrolase
MITDNMRVLLADPRGMEVVNSYLHAIETQNLAALRLLMSPDLELIHANYPAVRGRDAAAEMISGYLAIVAGVEFEIRAVMGDQGCYAIEKVNVAAGPTGSKARIRVVTVLEAGEDGLLTSIRIYADTADLFRRLELAASAAQA